MKREDTPTMLPAQRAYEPLGAYRKAGRLSVARNQLLNLVEMTLEPLALVLSLWAMALLMEGTLAASHIILGVIVFSLTFPSEPRLSQSALRAAANVILSWLVLSGLLALFGYASGYLSYFNRDMLVAWWLV